MNPGLRACFGNILVFDLRICCTWKHRSQVRWIAIAAALLIASGFVQLSSAQTTIHVNTITQGVTYGTACSLQEAIYSAEFGNNIAIDSADPDHTYSTGCEVGTGNGDTIALPGGTLQFSTLWDGDAHNPFGPTATPIIFKTMTIQGNGTTLQWTGSGYARLFAIGYASVTPTSGVVSNGTFSGTGNLTLQDVYIKGFQAKGGDGGYGLDFDLGGSGGGLGAGGAIYVGEFPGAPGVPVLTVQNSTFDGNGATGGNGNTGAYSSGGGGMGGNGGIFGGGGGSRGNGGKPCRNGPCSGSGGGGGGTVYGGSDNGPGGYLCGGSGGSSSNHDGHDATCAGGGGGGFYFGENGNGGNGAFGGGGGGGGDQGENGNGGNGGFGGGGGEGYNGGGNGGFGGGGGGGGEGYGLGGAFGGNASLDAGGGGGALGGAIFNDSGTVTIQNSTFNNNSVTRGLGGSFGLGGPADNGGDSGGAIFSRNGSLTVQDVTISGNQATGAGGGVVVMKDGDTTTFVLDNTIIANNGAQECIVTGTVTTTGSQANLIVNNSGCPKVTVNTDPKLDSLKLNTPGDTPTMALLSGSPAIDTGDDTTALATDQRGVARPQGAHSDIGAYEKVPQADLSLSKAVSSRTAKAGDTVTYTLTLTNLGPDAANSVTVTDNFPTALTYVSCTATGGGSCGTQGAAVVTTYTTLGANSSQTITISGTLNSGYSRGTVITNDASVQASSPADPDSSNNSSSASFTVIVPDFTLTAVSPISVDVGGSGTSSLTISSIDTFSSAVSLTSSGPTGFNRSFSPNPVTPPSNGSTSSTLTVTLEPSVTAGSYTVSETGTSGTLTHSTSVTVNVQSTIAGTINVIGADQALGCIDNSGISGALKSKLTAAQADITAGKIQEAINTLEALLNQLQAQAGKHIKTTCTDSSGNTFNPDAVLIADVKALLASLGVTVADPIVGNVLNASGAGISGVTVKILNSKNATVATAATDVTGFYYFPATGGLTPGASYTAKVTVPKGYKNSTPSSRSFTWKAVAVILNNFVLN